jgi:Zn-finger nucleic acid-binding protein
MNCPKCTFPMAKVSFGGAAADRCTNCQGLFFDELEKETLRKRKIANALDIGDARIGKRFNKVDHIECPRCGGTMMRMVDFQQPHIWFEQCKVCGGSFFDAGEFKDLSHHTILDYFKDMLVVERK